MAAFRYRCEIQRSADYDDIEVSLFQTKRAAFEHGDRNASRAAWEPRVYLEQMARYPEDDVHVASEAWEDVRGWERDQGIWFPLPTDH